MLLFKDFRSLRNSKVLSRFISQYSENISASSVEELKLSSVQEPSKPPVGNYSEIYDLASNHPGRLDSSTVQLPSAILSAAEKILKDSSVKDLKKKGAKLTQYLLGRHPPVKDSVAQELAKKYEDKYRQSDINIEYLSQQKRQEFEHEIVRKVLQRVKKRLYHWEPLNFTEESSLVYFVARFAPNYATLNKIFGEIKNRDPRFSPGTVLDFGSGLGSTFWATSNTWSESHIKECVNIESSSVMSTLSARLLEDGLAGLKPENFRGISFRKYLPATNTPKFDLVVSAHSMFEMPTTEDRLKTALSLWNKTNKYLVLCEQGSKAGHRILMEIRSFLADATKDAADDEACRVVFPCPHQLSCPRVAADDGTPCNFGVKYHQMGTPEVYPVEKYSYIVLHKGVLPETEDSQWPRLVRETMVRARHTICEVCTSQGTLQRWTFTKGKHSASGMYQIARKSVWGDRLPIELTDDPEEPVAQDL